MNRGKEVYSRLQKLKIEKGDSRYVLPNAANSQIFVCANLWEW
jgi:thymidylate synthase ThyX